MIKRMEALLVVVVLVFFITPTASSQRDQTQPAYTYVSQFQIPRANWAQYGEDTDKNVLPVLERAMADGTIIGYSTFEHIVHTPDGMTNGATWTSHSIAGLMKVLDELRKSPPRPGQVAATKHEDYLMQSVTHETSTVKDTQGYLRVVCQMAQPGKGDEYAAALKKHLWPAFEDQFKKGVVSSFGLDQQYVITSPASLRCLVITYPNADGMDKWATTVNGTLSKMSQADRDSFFGTTVPDARRDILARLTHYAHK